MTLPTVREPADGGWTVGRGLVPATASKRKHVRGHRMQTCSPPLVSAGDQQKVDQFAGLTLLVLAAAATAALGVRKHLSRITEECFTPVVRAACQRRSPSPTAAERPCLNGAHTTLSAQCAYLQSRHADSK